MAFITSNFELDDMMSKVKDFKGVHTKDIIPNIKKGESIIINLDDSDGDGTHWVCCFHGDYMEYFDSFGLPPPENVLKMMKKMNKNCCYSTSQIQEAASSMCGYFCMYYIKHRKKGEKMYDILYKFNQLDPIDTGESKDILMDFFNLSM